MSVRRLAPKEQQPESFAFSEENLAWANKQIAQYPAGRQASASIAILWRAQEQHGGWISEAAIRVVADMLDMPYIRMLEIATFYTMFQLQPVGKKAHIQVCGTTPCRLRGAEDILAVCKSRIHHEPFHLSKDGDFSWEEVECLGACVNAPMVLIWKDTYEDLTKENFGKVLDGFASGQPPKPGPQIDRQYSAPVGGPTTLNTVAAKGEGRSRGADAKRPPADDATKKGKT
jgi:NADH-quinone oxidoreductase subunit E